MQWWRRIKINIGHAILLGVMCVLCTSSTLAAIPMARSGEHEEFLKGQVSHERFAIDERRIYTTGFSGGARIASWLALVRPGLVAGVIACSGGFPANISQPSAGQFIFFATAGTEDFNFPEMHQLTRKLKARGITYRLAVFEGGHDWPPKELCSEALGWMEIQAMKAGKRTRDTGLIDEIFSAQLTTARDQEARQTYEAYLNYEALADEFRGLRDVKDLEASAARL